MGNAGSADDTARYQRGRCTEGYGYGGWGQRVPSPQFRRYLITNQGIPIKKSSTITPEKALHLSFLITDYWATAKKVIQCDLKMHDVVFK